MNETCYHNLNGVELSLEVNKSAKTNACLEFSVKYTRQSKSNLYKLILLPIVLLLILSVAKCCCLIIISTLILIVFIITVLTGRIWKIENESLLFIASIGVQITESYPFGRQTSQFVPWNKIRDVCINEVIHLQRVIFYLVILTIDDDETEQRQSIIPLFVNTTPPLACLETIYKNIQTMLRENTFSIKKQV